MLPKNPKSAHLADYKEVILKKKPQSSKTGAEI